MGAVLRHSGYATASKPVDEALSIIAEGAHSGSKIPRADARGIFIIIKNSLPRNSNTFPTAVVFMLDIQYLC